MIAVVPAGLILTVSVVMILLYRRDRRRVTRNLPAPAVHALNGEQVRPGGEFTELQVAEFAALVSAWSANGDQS